MRSQKEKFCFDWQFGHIMSYIMGNEDKIFEFIDAWNIL